MQRVLSTKRCLVVLRGCGKTTSKSVGASKRRPHERCLILFRECGKQQATKRHLRRMSFRGCGIMTSKKRHPRRVSMSKCPLFSIAGLPLPFGEDAGREKPFVAAAK